MGLGTRRGIEWTQGRGTWGNPNTGFLAPALELGGFFAVNFASLGGRNGFGGAGI